MAVKIEDLKYVLGTAHDGRSTGVVSGVIDCTGADRCTLILKKTAFTSKGSRLALKARHATSSSITYASATAFSTAIAVGDAAAGSAASIHKVDIDMRGLGPFVRYTLSTITASAKAGVDAFLTENDAVPPASTGFTSVTSSPVNP